MASIKIPMTDLAFYRKEETPLVKKKLDTIYNNYGNFIANSSKLCNVPEDVIHSFIFIESAGNPKAVSKAGAIGLMQLKPESASDMIHLENKSGNLSEQEKVLARKFLGSRLDCILKMKYMGHKLPCNQNKGYSVTKEDLLKPEFNIFCGTLYLSVLMRLHTENGIIRLDKVVVRYNRGYFSKPDGSLEQLLKKSPKETRDYITKLVGKYSPLDILTA